MYVYIVCMYTHTHTHSLGSELECIILYLRKERDRAKNSVVVFPLNHVRIIWQNLGKLEIPRLLKIR